MHLIVKEHSFFKKGQELIITSRKPCAFHANTKVCPHYKMRCDSAGCAGVTVGFKNRGNSYCVTSKFFKLVKDITNAREVISKKHTRLEDLIL